MGVLVVGALCKASQMAFSEDLRQLSDRVRNWGRWGDDDERGTLNFLGPEATLRGSACVQSGKTFSLAVDLKADGIQVGQPANRYNPILSVNSLNERDKFAPGIWFGTDDLVTMSTCAGTHIDGLTHVGYDDQFYGGKPSSTNSAAKGASWAGVEKYGPIVGRAILFDIARHLGVDRLDAGHGVTPTELDGCLHTAGLTLETGDICLIRTGDMQYYKEGERRRYAVGQDWKLPGIHPDCIEWFFDHEVAAVFTDTYTFEVFPPPSGNWDDLLAVHMLHLRDMGLVQGQNWDFEALAADCAEDNRYAVMLVAGPEPLVGATSAPTVPVAIK